MASPVALASKGAGAVTEAEERGKEPVQPQDTGSDMSKPHHKVFIFASPKKRADKQPEKRAPPTKQAIKAKFRKALAPYLTSSYLQGEMAKRFTKEYIAAHPPPQTEEELPDYIQGHLEELNRVTERWSGCVGRALDPLVHETAVEGRLQRLRAREEGLSVEPPLGGGGGGGARGTRQGGSAIDEYDDDLDLDWGMGLGIEGGLTSAQVFGAVHLVSDVQVWQQILAAQRAEERRQHAIAELHLNHAARIIQRSWHEFITRKKEEQARLDALVSPDVQAMLGAAAYKAMRDARNKLAVLKLRKSLSRKARGFGSTAPRDLDPIPRQSGQVLAGPASAQQPVLAVSSPVKGVRESRSTVPGATRSSGGIGFARSGGLDGLLSGDSSDEGGGDAAGTLTEGEGGGDGGGSRSASPGHHAHRRSRSGVAAVAKLKSFASRSARIVTRLVSIKEMYDGENDGEAEGDAGGAGGGDEEGVRQRRQAHKARRRRARGKRSSGVAAEGAEAGEGDGGGGGGGGATGAEGEEGAAGEGAAGEGAEGEGAEGDGEDGGEWDEEDDEFDLGTGEGDSDSECASRSEEDEEETAEAAMAEAEEVVQVAAELAKAFLGSGAGGGDSSDEGSGSEDDGGTGDGGEGVLGRIGEEALRALSSVEVAAAALDAAGGKATVSPLAPPPLRAAMAAAEAAADGAIAARARRAAAATDSGPHRAQSLTLTEDAAVIRQLIAGALAAAASPVLGRKKAMAMAQMGLGELLQLPGAKGMLPKAAAAAAQMRPSPGHKDEPLQATGRAPGGGGGAVAGGSSGRGGQHHPQPLEIRAAAAMALGMPAGGKAAGVGARLSGSEGGSAAAAAAYSRTAWSSGQKSIAGDTADGSGGSGGGANASPQRRMARMSYVSGAVTLPSVHPGAPAGDTAFEAADASAAAFRHSHAMVGGGAFGGAGYSPRISPTGVSAAAAAAMATQPWASPRRMRHPPGAHTMAGAIPDLRTAAGGGGAFGGGAPREPSWLLPPINRSSTGPAVLGGGGGAGAAGGLYGPTAAVTAAAAVAAASGMARTSSDPMMLQRPFVGGGTGGGSSGGGAAAVAGGPGALAAAAAAAAVGRARRASVVNGAGDVPTTLQSVEVGTPLVVQQSSFLINSLSPAGATQVAQKVRLSSLAAAEASLQPPPQPHPPPPPPQQPVPLPSALAGGGGGAGGGTAAARQAQFGASARSD